MRFLLALLLTCLPAFGQDIEPGRLGLQGRLSLPLGAFRDALGGSKAPGGGLSLFAEIDPGEGFRVRLGLGGDLWTKGGGLPGEDRDIEAVHLSAEAVYFLQDEGPQPILGAYLVAGLGAYSWNLGKDVNDLGQTRRFIHAAATFGFGWRFTRHLDGEVKLLTGPLDPGINASAFVAAVNLRF